MWPSVITIGLKNTLIYTALAFIFGLVLGLIIALMRLSSVGPYRWFATAYVELFRGLPALLVLFLVAYGIPNAFPGFQFPGGFYGQVMVGLGLTAAAYMAETIRAGIQAVPEGTGRGGPHAGMSLGPDDGQHRAAAGLPDRHPAADQRDHPAGQGLVAGLRARRDLRAVRADEVQPGLPEPHREPHTARGRRPCAISSSPCRCRASSRALEKRYAKAR